MSRQALGIGVGGKAFQVVSRGSISRESVKSLELERKAEVRLCRVSPSFLRSSDIIVRWEATEVFLVSRDIDVF